jgi:radical SAM-linked protein
LITVRIRFEKTGEASYISLLDMQRVMQRVLKRSGVPVWYTLGFNPHIYMTFSCPLPLGQESLCESVDVKTEAEAPDLSGWQDALNAVMPAGIHVYSVSAAEIKADAIAFAAYTIRYSASEKPLLEKYNALPSAEVDKKSKRAVKTVDLKEYIPALELQEEGESVRFDLKLPASGSFNVNPALLTKFLEDTFGVPASDARVLRTNLLTQDGTAF